MKIALLVTGGVRTFVCAEQIASFHRVLNTLRSQGSVDSFMCLGLREETENAMVRSRAGLHNLHLQLQQLKPAYIRCFYSTSAREQWRWSASQQIEQIEHARLAAGDGYDWYVRWRPDYACTRFDVRLRTLDPGVVHTCVKCDAPGSDMVFMFAQALLPWWKAVVVMRLTDQPLEYLMFRGVTCVQRQEIVGGLFRCFMNDRRLKNIAPWDRRKLFNHELYYRMHEPSAHEQLFLLLSRSAFDTALRDILAKYAGTVLCRLSD